MGAGSVATLINGFRSKTLSPFCTSTGMSFGLLPAGPAIALPTEAEWEMSASAEVDSDRREIAQRKRLYPWAIHRPDQSGQIWTGATSVVLQCRALPAKRERLWLPSDDWQHVGMDRQPV